MRHIYYITGVFFFLGLSCSRSFKKEHHRPDHIVIVMEENHSYSQIIGNPKAPYINSLADEGLSFTHALALAHASQPNYIALFSGSTQGVQNDRCLKNDTPYITPNLGHALLTKGFSFAGYSETMPTTGFIGCGDVDSIYEMGGPLYARKHNPWVDWQGNSPTGLPDSTNKTFQAFPTDFEKLPDVAFVVPNEDNEMHNGPDSLSIPRGDQWLKKHMSPYIQWAKNHNSLFILTYDENNGVPINRIPMIFVGPMVKAGQYDSTVNHYSVLRTIEYFYGLPIAGPATEKPITKIWKW